MLVKMERGGYGGGVVLPCNSMQQPPLHFGMLHGPNNGKLPQMCAMSPRMRMACHPGNGNGIPPHMLSALVHATPACIRTNKQQQQQHMDTLQLQQLHNAHFSAFPFQMTSLLTHASQHKAMTSPEPNLKLMGFEFSQKELDMVLYGYARGSEKENQPGLGLALSGLRIGELSYGIDRILGQSSPRSAVTAHVDPSSIEMPEGLELKQTTFAGMVHYGVFCSKGVIPKGTTFGPFHGKLVNMSEIKTNDDNSFMWEIFKEGKLSHFIDGRGNAGNWMAYVNCARYAQEQNLIATQSDGDISYEACKDIADGCELLVWYGDTYLQFMGIPINLKDSHKDGFVAMDTESGAGFKCERCGKVFAYEYYRDKHLKYTRCVDQGDRKFPCSLCTRSFEKRDRLRIHILHVHEKHRPHKCHVCAKSFSQSSSLNKHMRVHSGERPYKCVYCSKAFTASSILRTHIRQHSGEKPFKCKHCGKAFASHAAHDSHVRRTHAKDRVDARTEDTIDVVGYEPTCK